jgi:hypothetical protein
VGSTWPAHAVTSSVVGVVHVSVSFILGSNVALACGDVRSVALPVVVDGGCYGIVKVKATPACGLRGGRA